MNNVEGKNEMVDPGEWAQLPGGDWFMYASGYAGIEAVARRMSTQVGGTFTVSSDDSWEWRVLIGHVDAAEGLTYARGVAPVLEKAQAAAMAALRVLGDEIMSAVSRAEGS